MSATGDDWLQNYLLNVWEFVHGETQLESLPWNVTLPVADLCNARCTFCTSWLEGRSLVKLDEVRNFSEVFARAHQIGLVGHGEPLAHPQFDKLCGRSSPRAMDPRAYIYTITNGVHLKKWSTHLNRINLDVKGLDKLEPRRPAKTHDLVMGLGPDAFEEVVSAIRDVVAASSPTRPRQVYITMVVTQQNMHEVADFVRLGNELGVSGVWLRALLPQSRSRPRTELSPSRAKPPIREFRRHRTEALAAIAGSESPGASRARDVGRRDSVGTAEGRGRSQSAGISSLARKPSATGTCGIGITTSIRCRQTIPRRGQPLDVSAHSTVKRYEDGIYIGTPATQWSYALTGSRWRRELAGSTGVGGCGAPSRERDLRHDRVWPNR